MDLQSPLPQRSKLTYVPQVAILVTFLPWSFHHLQGNSWTYLQDKWCPYQLHQIIRNVWSFHQTVILVHLLSWLAKRQSIFDSILIKLMINYCIFRKLVLYYNIFNPFTQPRNVIMSLDFTNGLKGEWTKHLDIAGNTIQNSKWMDKTLKSNLDDSGL